MAISTTDAINGNDYLRGLTEKKKAADAVGQLQEQQDRFLTLLVTQIKNQDPLNPMDNAQMTTQLAQINMAQGVEKMNANMSKLIGYYEESQTLQAAAMIGKSVLVSGGKNLPLGDLGAMGGLELPADAESVKVTIKNSAGAVVNVIDLGQQNQGTVMYQWDGKDMNGQPSKPGNYSVTVDAVAGGQKITTDNLQVGTVRSLIRNPNGSGFSLDLGSAGEVGFDQVKRII